MGEQTMGAFKIRSIDWGSADADGGVTLTISEGLLESVSKSLIFCGKNHGNTAQESLGYFLRDAFLVIQGLPISDFPKLASAVENLAPEVEESAVTIEDHEPVKKPRARKSKKSSDVVAV
jgi:hypothetical protein